MAQIVVHNAATLAPYQGENEIQGIRFRPARQHLGVSAFGMNVLDLDAGCTGYPVHDHNHDGQEEVYIILEGSAQLIIGETSTPLVQGDMVPRAARSNTWLHDRHRGSHPGARRNPRPGLRSRRGHVARTPTVTASLPR